jgi:hypothetical protein
MRNIKLHIILHLLTFSAWGWMATMQTASAATPSLFDADTLQLTQYEEREFDAQQLEQLRNNPDYDYERIGGQSLWDRFLDWLRRLFSNMDESDEPIRMRGPSAGVGGLSIFAQALLWVLIAGIAAFLIFQLLKVDFRKLIRKKSDDGNVDYEVQDDVLEKLPFQELIEDAVARGQYRMAVRFHYLRCLKYLQEKELIVWKFEKTNSEYLTELDPTPLRKPFGELTRLYEYIWYGEFAIEKAEYHTSKESFLKFEESVKGGAREK